MDNILIKLADYGQMGIMMAILIYYVYKKEKDALELRKRIDERHNVERTEWREQAKEQFTRLYNITDTNNNVLNELKMVINSLKDKIN